MDQMGEVDYAPGEPKGTPWHPHRGFETVTYMIDGTFAHQDSHGGGGLITDGDTQWMTAGAGILHIETPPEELVVSGGLFHGVQLWVNLPAKDKMIPPRYQGLVATRWSLLSPTTAARSCGSSPATIDGHPARDHPHADGAGPRLRSRRAQAGAALEPQLQRARVRARRSGTGGCEARPSKPDNWSRSAGDWISARASDARTRAPAHLELLVLGGQPIREPVEPTGRSS